MKVKKSIGEHLPKYRFRVRSKSRPDEFHLVEIFANDSVECACIAGFYKAECKHKKFTRRNLVKIKKYLDDYWRNKQSKKSI